MQLKNVKRYTKRESIHKKQGKGIGVSGFVEFPSPFTWKRQPEPGCLSENIILLPWAG